MRPIGVQIGQAESDRQGQAFVAAFRDELRKLGWTEGGNIRIDTRWATAGDAEARQRFAKELVALQPDLILSHGTPTTATLLQQTRTIPIVFAAVSDPIGSGFVASFPQPGGNVTGFMNMEPTMAGKWIEMLKEIAPPVARVALLFNPATAPYAENWLNPFKAAAASFGIQGTAALVHDTSELESVLAAQAREPNGGLIVMPDTFTTARRAEITALAARHRLPTVYPFRYFAQSGGLLSYGTDLVHDFRRAATYADRILKGAKPSELPVQGPVKFELVINLKTAKALGLDISADAARPRRRGDRMRAARVHHAARRCGVGLAARGTGAAACNVDDWVRQQSRARGICGRCGSLSSGPRRGGICRRSESGDRVSLGGRPL